MKFHLTDIVQTMLYGEFPVDSLLSELQTVAERAEIKLMLKEVCKVEMILTQRLAALMSNLQQAKAAGSSVATEKKHRALSESKKLMTVLHDMRRANQVSRTLVQFIDDFNINTNSSITPEIPSQVYETNQEFNAKSQLLRGSLDSLKQKLARCFRHVDCLDDSMTFNKMPVDKVE
jgi:small-conductance mechanosensitive channel